MTDPDRQQCTDKLCENPGKYALWMGERFSRLVDGTESEPYEEGDYHPFICENCLNRYREHHDRDGWEFVRPEEKLVTDGGQPDCGACGRTHDTMAEAIECCDDQLGPLPAVDEHGAVIDWRSQR